LRAFHIETTATGKYETQKNMANAKNKLSNGAGVAVLSFNKEWILESMYIEFMVENST
jgi:hypothetical protein